MYNKSPITSIKKRIREVLALNENLSYCDVRETYLNEMVDLPLKRPLITISRGRIFSKPTGFQDFIENNIRGDKFIEIRGKELTLNFEIDIWNNDSPKFGGETTIEIIKESLFELFEFYPKIIPNCRVIEFKDGDTFEDPFEEGLFHSRNSLKLRMLWTKEFEYELLDGIESNSIIVD